MLVKFENYFKKQNIYKLKLQAPTKRMSLELQKKMIKNFEKFKLSMINE